MREDAALEVKSPDAVPDKVQQGQTYLGILSELDAAARRSAADAVMQPFWADSIPSTFRPATSSVRT